MYYFLAPILAWLVAGTLKFIINYFRYGHAAKNHIGNGGFPSNHTTIVSTITMLIGFHEGFDSALFGLGVAVTMIVIIDAIGLRRYVGYHAVSLNILLSESNNTDKTNTDKPHREKIGHTKFEVIGGFVLGTILGYLFHLTM